MVDIRTLGAVDFLDETKYTVPLASEGGAPTYDIVENAIRNTGFINLALSKKTAHDFVFDVMVHDASSWQAVLTNIAAIQTELTNAELWHQYESTAPVYYTESWGDQTVPTVWNVVRGKVWELRGARERSLISIRTMVHVELHCEPEPL